MRPCRKGVPEQFSEPYASADLLTQQSLETTLWPYRFVCVAMPSWCVFHHYTVFDVENVIAADKPTGASSKGIVRGEIHVSARIDATRTEALTDVSLVWIVSYLDSTTRNRFYQRQCDE